MMGFEMKTTKKMQKLRSFDERKRTLRSGNRTESENECECRAMLSPFVDGFHFSGSVFFSRNPIRN